MKTTVDLTKSVYRVYYGQLERVPVVRRETIVNFRAEAAAYVWGWEDAGGKRRTESDDSWNFSCLYGHLAALFELGLRSSRPPFRTAFQHYLKTGNVDC